MSLPENRHHRWRIIQARIRAIKERWGIAVQKWGEAWAIKQARRKTNPFTACSCEGCQCSSEHHASHKRERKAAKAEIKDEISFRQE